MTSVDEYVSEVRRGTRGMDRGAREDILRELRSHITEAVAANGGDVPAALAGLGNARTVAKGYVDLYGFGRGYRALFVAIAALIAAPTVPVLQVTEEALAPYGLSVPFLVALVAWLLWVSVRAGSRVGLYAGTAACVGRLAAFGLAGLLQAGGTTVPGGLALFVATSAVLVLLGWLPGSARKAWASPRADL